MAGGLLSYHCKCPLYLSVLRLQNKKKALKKKAKKLSTHRVEVDADSTALVSPDTGHVTEDGTDDEDTPASAALPREIDGRSNGADNSADGRVRDDKMRGKGNKLGKRGKRLLREQEEERWKKAEVRGAGGRVGGEEGERQVYAEGGHV